MEYLGHVIYLGDLGVQQTKVEAIACISRPTDVSKAHAFMGLANYYAGMSKALMRWQSL